MSTLPTQQSSEWIEDINKSLKFDLTTQDDQDLIDPNDDLFVDIKPFQLNENYKDCSQSDASNLFTPAIRKLGEFVMNSTGNDKSLLISQKQFQNSMHCVDIVTCDSTRTNCFTKKYEKQNKKTLRLVK